jgi:hypothetical protein
MKKNPLPTPAATPPAAPAELATKAHEGTPQYGDYGHPPAAPAPPPVPDHRAEGGNAYDLRHEQTAL